MWKVRVGLMCVVNSSMRGSSFFTGFGLSLLLSLLSSKARTNRDISIATRDTAREAAERVINMVNFDSVTTGITVPPLSPVTVSIAVMTSSLVVNWFKSSLRNSVVLASLFAVVEEVAGIDSFGVVDITSVPLLIVVVCTYVTVDVVVVTSSVDTVVVGNVFDVEGVFLSLIHI